MVRRVRLDHVEQPEQQERDERPCPSDGVHEQGDQHAHHFIDDHLTGVGSAEMFLGDAATPGSYDEDRDNGDELNGWRGWQDPPEKKARGGTEGTRCNGYVADAEKGRDEEREKSDWGFGIGDWLGHDVPNPLRA